MKGLIDGTGCLHIKRGGKFKLQHCAKDGDVSCGDECPLFTEPVTHFASDEIRIVICESRLLVFDSFEDRRVEEDIT